MENNFHTVKITGHLTFDSRHTNFRTAFKEFIEKEGLQLQVTDMVNKAAPSMELGVKLTVSTDFVNFSDQRYADGPLPDHPKVPKLRVVSNTVEKVVEKPVEKQVKRPRIKPVNPQTGSDLAFY